MTQRIGDVTVGITAGSEFDLEIERSVFEGTDATLRPVDIGSTDDLIAELADVDAVIDRLLAAPYTASVVDALEACDVIARCGIGVDGIDLERAAQRGMYVLNVPEYCQYEVSEHTMMLLLAVERTLPTYDTAMKDGVWARDVTTPSVHRLHGQTMGLVGFGTIGRLVAERADAFGMEVVAFDPHIDATEMEQAGVKAVEFDELLAVSDAVSLHTPLVEDTEGMLDAAAFERMKETAVLINVARGGLVVEDDLVAALQSGDIAGAGLDVFDEEPSSRGDSNPPFSSPLRDLERVILTPHVAWFSREANDERRRTAARDVRRVLAGKEPENAVVEPSSVRET
ncbi:C-terminal binding protein [Halostagnicola kamekurae]|uniref:D-3-phosphoglycerate dehydrogenase n=1 Tax=Halostagnicola kamekurae TaxID=619731 RepID=A0A1I6UJF5_9EURY|nr:C-terminal binding protein [Halostagnicola kamekurae]SFT01582.1 D-3-phosphoglycerate dehydrogenase [Halostagnicola kamekurae]